MDTSKHYIKMCDCHEIQDIKPEEYEDQEFIANFHKAKACPDHGEDHLWTKDLETDFFCCTCGKELIEVSNIPLIESYDMNGAERSVWLPRQDQLIDMFPNGELEMDVFRTNSGKWQIQVEDGNYYSTGYHESLSKALLVFLMHELHKKEWTGKAWV